MKNQYFGDINDYRKYGLLRQLVPAAGLPTVIAWMLTPDDGRPDGGKTGYLAKPDAWREYDPDLFDFLERKVLAAGRRDIGLIERSGLLPGCIFHSTPLEPNLADRVSYFENLWKLAGDSALLFFDPDNGFEVPSRDRESKYAHKYLYWCEFSEAYRRGHSILAFQHFRQGERADVTAATSAQRCLKETGARRLAVLWASPVLYFLVGQPDHEEALMEAGRKAAECWRHQITWWMIEAG